MEKEPMLSEFIQEAELVIRGLVSAGYAEQFARISFDVVSDFFLKFPQSKQFFALSAEQGRLKYFSFDNKVLAEKAIKQFEKNGDFTKYRIVSRAIAEMIGREFEYYQYIEEIASTDDQAEDARKKQVEIIDSIFSD